MSESKALFYLVEEWSDTKSIEELLPIVEIIIDTGIVEDLQHSEVPVSQWRRFMEIADSEKFAETLREYFDLSKDGAYHSEDHKRHLTEIRRLVDLINQEKSPSFSPEVIDEYLRLVLDITDYYENTYVFIENREDEIE